MRKEIVMAPPSHTWGYFPWFYAIEMREGMGEYSLWSRKKSVCGGGGCGGGGGGSGGDGGGDGSSLSTSGFMQHIINAMHT